MLVKVAVLYLWMCAVGLVMEASHYVLTGKIVKEGTSYGRVQ